MQFEEIKNRHIVADLIVYIFGDLITFLIYSRITIDLFVLSHTVDVIESEIFSKEWF